VINVARLPISFITVTVTATTTIIIIIIIIIIVHYTTGASHKALYHRDSAFVFQRATLRFDSTLQCARCTGYICPRFIK